MASQDHTVGVFFYSMTGNVLELARAAAEGAERVPGISAPLHPVAELVPDEIIQDDGPRQRVHEAKQAYDEADVDMLADYDGFLFATPTRYGRMCAQLANFLDQTGGIWQEGSTIGKPAGVLTSTASVHGGQETTIVSTWATLAHLGMLPVGVPYSEERLFALVPEGGSPYGASSVSGPEADKGPTERERAIARTQGRRVAELVRVIAAGQEALEDEVELVTLVPA